jgi:hypothetical protein
MGGCGAGTALGGPTLLVVGTTNVHVCGAAAFPAPVTDAHAQLSANAPPLVVLNLRSV